MSFLLKLKVVQFDEIRVKFSAWHSMTLCPTNEELHSWMKYKSGFTVELIRGTTKNPVVLCSSVGLRVYFYQGTEKAYTRCFGGGAQNEPGKVAVKQETTLPYARLK